MTGIRVVAPELARRYEEQGWWTPDTLGDLLARSLKDNQDTTFRVHSSVHPYTGTFGDVERMARRLAAGLRARGVGPGDVVAFQLPNWVEAAVTFWASAFLSAVVVPIVHFYGPKELRYILSSVRPRVFITAEGFGRMTYAPEVCADVPTVALAGESFDELLADEPMAGTLGADPAGPALIAFTSGTTSNPKGVIHSHQTLGFETRQLLSNYPQGLGRQLTALPVGHFIGMLGAFLIPVLDGSSIDLTDVWDPDRAIDLMDSDGVALGGGRRTSSPACSITPGSPPSTCASSRTSASADRPSRRPSPGAWPTWGSSSPAPTAAPSTRRSPDRITPHRRTSGSSPTARRARASRSA